MKKIYLVEDDENLNLILSSYLEREGFIVNSFLNGIDAKKNIPNPPDLWILDIMLPDIDGYRLIKEIKNTTPGVPIIFISARDADIDRVLGLELGCDDYLPKPFLPRELIIRTKNILDRYKKDEAVEDKIGTYKIDRGSRIVKKNNEPIKLTSKEYNLLLYFLENIGLAVSREQILDFIWEEDYFGSDRVVDDLVRRLRKKMEDLNIETLYGYGYRMVSDEK
ncbi:response regulator transcription factor [Tissierella creatinophila]|uniref:Transcriptional regulatory protein CssR n=1 Tax=Tissierella creatinophila DSM 6911 TaxID=1123403 RepID=A0A1U7M2G3_TISCR|nr:response regulator transcription factor [Tissierella creatinophila]OLS01502.1 transcriptional regulatory protein CssR [Tissierella creatinophila DSM 6911]